MTMYMLMAGSGLTFTIIYINYTNLKHDSSINIDNNTISKISRIPNSI